MIEHRFRARVEDGMTEGGIDGSAPRLVTVCLSAGSGGVSNGLGEPVTRAPVVSYLRPGEARALAFCLLGLAERAEQRTGARR